MVRTSTWIWGVMLICVGIIVGCAKPPTEQIDLAKAAVASAQRAEAEKYAPQEFSTLQDSLNAALAAVDKQKARFALFRNYDQARALALNVIDRGPSVEDKARENKAKIKRETESLIAEAQAAIDSARSVLGTAPVGKGTKADIEQFTADLSALQASLSEAGSAVSREDFSGATARAQTIRSRANSLKDEIQTAIEKQKQWRRGRKR